MKIMLSFAGATFAVATVVAAGVAYAGANDVTLVSGSQSCPIGHTVYVQVQVYNSQQVNLYVPASKSTPSQTTWINGTATTFYTNLQSTSWKVTGSNLGPVNDYCTS
jgi:hypothetical protein